MIAAGSDGIELDVTCGIVPAHFIFDRDIEQTAQHLQQIALH